MRIPKIKFQLDRERGKLAIRPYRDWAIVLGTFAVLLAATAFYHFALFQRFARAGEVTLEDIVKTQIKVISQKDLRDTIERLEKQRALFNSLYSSRPAVIDPAK